MVLDRPSQVAKVVVLTAALSVLAACGGGDQEPSAAPSTTPRPTTSVTQGPRPSGEVEVKVADPEALTEVEASMQALNTERESLDSSEYLNRANELTARGAAAYGPEGLGVFACQITVGIVSGAQGAKPAAVKVGLGNTLVVVVRNATGELKQTLAGAGLDALMTKTCPDVRKAALKAAGVNSLDAL